MVITLLPHFFESQSCFGSQELWDSHFYNDLIPDLQGTWLGLELIKSSSSHSIGTMILAKLVLLVGS